MTIESKKNAGKLTLTITGRLDTSTAPKLEETLKGAYDGVTELVFDLAKLERVHIKRASKIIANMITERKIESSLS